MEIQSIEFNHNASDIATAMDISNLTERKCRERVMFCSFSNFVQVDELYDSREDAPKELTTFTGDLQRCLSMITDPIEYQYTLLVFMGLQRQCLKYSALFDILEKDTDNKAEKNKRELLRSLLEFAASDNEEDSQFGPSNMLKRIKLIKQSHHNFDTYMNLVNSKIYNQTSSGSDFDVDDLLNDLGLN